MLETDRLLLRPFTEADKDWSAEQEACPIVMEHLGGSRPRAEADARVDKMIALQAARGFSFWVLERKAEGDRIGIAGLKLVDAVNAPMAGSLEIGWRLGREHWSQGYAREAASAALDHAFGPLAAPHVLSFTGQPNRASWGLMERLGMTRRPDLDFLDPRFADPTIVYLIEAAAWKA